MHKSNNIENVRNLSISLPGDSDAFQVNQEFVAYPLSGPGGQIAVVPVSVYSSWSECKTQDRYPIFQVTGIDDQRIFGGLKFSIPRFFWEGKFGKYFLGVA